MDQKRALLDALGEWDGFEVIGVERGEGDPDEIHVSLKPKEGATVCCNCCGRLGASGSTNMSSARSAICH